MKSQIKYLQKLFYDLLDDYGRVYIVVKYSERTTMGNRGFTAEEKEKGIILVFTSKNHKKLQWTEEGSIVTTLSFGSNSLENCFVHYDDIVTVYSPDAMVKFDRWDILNSKDAAKESGATKEFGEEDTECGKIVSLDNYRKKNG